MTEDANRIPEVMTALGELWTINPDLRLGQIMSNAAITFYTEDDKALLGLQQWIEYYKERSAGADE
jgi:hypothetical protein